MAKKTMAKKSIEKKVANYRVIIQKEYYPNGEPVYTADCPTLHVHDYGPTIPKVLERVREGIELALECLAEDKTPIPIDKEVREKFTVNTQVPLPRGARSSIPA